MSEHAPHIPTTEIPNATETSDPFDSLTPQALRTHIAEAAIPTLKPADIDNHDQAQWAHHFDAVIPGLEAIETKPWREIDYQDPLQKLEKDGVDGINLIPLDIDQISEIEWRKGLQDKRTDLCKRYGVSELAELDSNDEARALELEIRLTVLISKMGLRRNKLEEDGYKTIGWNRLVDYDGEGSRWNRGAISKAGDTLVKLNAARRKQESGPSKPTLRSTEEEQREWSSNSYQVKTLEEQLYAEERYIIEEAQREITQSPYSPGPNPERSSPSQSPYDEKAAA